MTAGAASPFARFIEVAKHVRRGYRGPMAGANRDH
jgi:hypothetical protein